MSSVPQHSTLRRYYKNSTGAPVLAQVNYGAYTFPAAVSLSFTTEPVYESSNRVPKWWKHTFTIETLIDPHTAPESDSTGLNPVDLNMSQVRRILQTPGLNLVIWNLGVGQNQRVDVSTTTASPVGVTQIAEPAGPSATTLAQDPFVSAGSPVKTSSHYSFKVTKDMDLNFGPKPQLLVCECVGAARIWRIIWTVEVALPNCCVYYEPANGGFLCLTPEYFNQDSYNDANSLKVTEFNYSLSWTIDESRFTTFSIFGTIEYAGILFEETSSYLHGGRTLSTQRAISFISNTFGLRPGFQRSLQYDVSRDKRRLDFRITDKEIPSDNPYWVGIIDCSMRHSISGSPLGNEWNVRFSGTFTTEAGFPKYEGLLAFVLVVQDRLKLLTLVSPSRIKDLTTGNTYLNHQPFFLPVLFDFEEDIFSRTTSFNFHFKVYTFLGNLLEANRFFAETPGNWVLHYASHSAETRNLEGTAQVRIADQYESLTTPCRNDSSQGDNITNNTGKGAPVQSYPLFTPTCPKREDSFVAYDNVVSFSIKNHLVKMIPMAKFSKNAYRDSLPNGNYSPTYPSALLYDMQDGEVQLPQGNSIKLEIQNQRPWDGDTGGQGTIKIGDMTTTYQSAGAPEYRIVMKGYAARLCYEVKVPEITAIQVYYGNQGPNWEPPLVHGEPRIIGPHALKGPSAVPLYVYEWEVEYVTYGIPTGAVRLLINGTSYEGRPEGYVFPPFKGAMGTNPSGMGIGSIAGVGFPTVPHQ